MVPMRRSHSLLSGFLVGLVAASGVLLVHFTLQLPTSDYRARLYFLLAEWPVGVSSFYFGATFLVATGATALAGGRDRWAFLGAAVAAAAAVAALWLHLFSYLVWMHDENVTPIGMWSRLAAAALGVVGVILLARSGRLTGAWSGRGI